MKRISSLIALASLLLLTPACGDGVVIAPAELSYELQRTHGHFDGLAFLVRDESQSRCIRIVVSSDVNDAIIPSIPSDIHTPEGLPLKELRITDDLADCVSATADEVAPPRGNAEQATSGLGRIEIPSSWQQGSLHVVLHFTEDDVIASQTVALDADSIEARP
jgi:hypothetical protein